ncbi:unnamed protein product [Strongylus vulgaris]|uniref:Uncharacterized protein n=1 Tax=Strongylus vulgaris TaxID=40348 RepID=A0A3P7JNC3_STRVU|nr:unnamed protein product [Strongylus vulgaris]
MQMTPECEKRERTAYDAPPMYPLGTGTWRVTVC